MHRRIYDTLKARKGNRNCWCWQFESHAQKIRQTCSTVSNNFMVEQKQNGKCCIWFNQLILLLYILSDWKRWNCSIPITKYYQSMCSFLKNKIHILEYNTFKKITSLYLFENLFWKVFNFAKERKSTCFSLPHHWKIFSKTLI